MGVAFSQLWARLFGKEEQKLLILGLDNAGKTTILYKITMGQAVETAPTVGSNHEVSSNQRRTPFLLLNTILFDEQIFEYKNLKFALWDIGGQTSIRASWPEYFTSAKAVILVVDSTDYARLSLSKEELHRMCEHDALKGAILLVLANKQDLPGCMTAARISEGLKLTELRDR
ncbi:hypothetical protein FRB99_008687 [Tulasnella sp. 403]|nr:hypothetical protein FRB99_008687 [Tulasnella sp. 403]